MISPARRLLIAICLAACFAMPAMAAGTFAARADVRAFVDEMVERHGFDRDALLAAFARIQPLPAVIKAIRPPADPGIRSWQAYRGRFVEPRRIAAGLRFWDEHSGDLLSASARYGVPEEVIVAIIGVETIYGRSTGRFGTLAALATLAFDYPPRAELFRRELEALLLLARDAGRDPLGYRGSYAGALGLPQFLPSSVRQWAVDFDGDGQVELTRSPGDAIGSVAHFLQAHGWQPGEPVTAPVELEPGSNPQPLIDEGIRPVRLPAEMRPLGVRTDAAAARPAALIDLVTPDAPTEYWLGYQNFFVITRYNKSSFYAMAVYQLAEALRTAR
ncbi:lytic murein transglycosylase B [Sulfurisoma sediminicola]|uniref:Membrane-bound lytic murein transglycosylase B n=1 Tax=Sulfurisoma sediminicola TaxID=1381557 RepID=A0A497XCS7_9PROT|nr:lytic murein transglycosylase B [Sulfurisoma sediminicola]RLJ64743.1 membrane-bound lytic murein transglycosylase B [Sulfurisoma sediminicola]